MNASDADVGADVVERDAPAELADPLDGAQQLRGPGGERALGDLQDDAQLAGRGVGDGEQVVQRRGVEHLGLDVDEQRQRRQQALRDGAAEGGGAADARRARPAGRPRARRRTARSGRASGPSGPRASAS